MIWSYVQRTDQVSNVFCHSPRACSCWGLEKALAIGIIVLSACPGGTASNIVAFIAKVGVMLVVVRV